MRRTGGYTLYEALMTLLLIAVLAGLGLPSYGGLVARSRIAVEVDALFHAVHLARKESIVRRQVVTICPSTDGTRCAAIEDWSTGWIMFNNRDRDSPPQRDDDEPLISAHFVNDRVMITANRLNFTLRSTQRRATNGTIVVCDRASRARPKALIVSHTGRPRVAVETPRGEPYACGG